METITKHPEFDKAFEAYATRQQLVEPFYGIACGDYAAGGEAAQAILQPEINRLRESNAELLAALTKLYSAMDSCIDLTPELMKKTRKIIRKHRELAEGPNK